MMACQWSGVAMHTAIGTGAAIGIPIAVVGTFGYVASGLSTRGMTQYSLGFVSSNKRADGKWRRIVVRVPAREDLKVRHKLGYFGVVAPK